MFIEERRQFIQQMLTRDRRVDVAELAQQMNMSPETVRRDLREMEADGLLKRTHGGAILADPVENGHQETTLITRQSVNSELKSRIAKRAAALVNNNDVIAIDNSSTALFLLQFLPRDFQLTIITNSISLVVEVLSIANHSWTCVSLGGIVSTHSNSTFGQPAVATLANFRPHKLFASCAGIDARGAVTEGNLNDAEMKRALISCSQDKILLADETKIGRLGAVNCATVNDYDYFITNDTVDSSNLAFLHDSPIKLVYDSAP